MASHTDQWLITLSAEQIREIESAAAHFLSLNRDIGEISASDFPLPSFKDHIDTLRHKLVHGNGVEVIRGLQASKYERKFAATIFCGIGAHLGIARSQNAQGHILGHVRDTGADANATDTRIYQTAKRQTFHTDSADVVGLICLKNAKACRYHFLWHRRSSGHCPISKCTGSYPWPCKRHRCRRQRH